MRWVPLAVACAAAVVTAQQETPRPRTVRIDAVVTDRTGRPLADLKAADFELRSGGVAQTIESLEYRAANASAAAGRVFALFLDEFHVSAANSELVRQTARRFMDEHVRSADRVAVMKPLDSQLDIQLTSDPAVWRRAIDTFDGRAGDFAPRTAFEEQYLGRGAAIVETSRAQIVTSGLRALVTRLGEASAGRSAVAFITEGFATGGRSDRERRLPDFQSIARVASRLGVSVYSISPAPPAGGAVEKEGDGIAARLKALAVDTGGETAAGDAAGAALARMSRDLDTYYVLTFTPSQASDGRFQRVELTSKRRGAIVRARNGFWTPAPAAAVARAEPLRPMRALRRSSLIETWYGLTRLPDGRMRLRVTWEPSRRKPASPRAVPEAVVIRATRPGSDPLFEGRISASQLAELIVPPGRVELDLSVVSKEGTEVDTETRDVDVPDANGRRVTSLAPEIIRARTLREFQAATGDPAAAPTPSREFRRSDRLIVRAPASSTEQDPLTVTARLLNRWGQPMRDLEAISPAAEGIVQFGLALAWLVPGEYEIELRTKQAGTEASQKIAVKVIG